MNMNKKVSFTALFLIVSLIFTMTSGFVFPVSAQKKQVSLTAIVAEPKERWTLLFNTALQKLKQKHPELDIKLDYRVLPYDATRTQILTSMAGKTPIDLISADQIWLGEFAQGGFN